MNSYAEYIKTVIGQEPENKLLEASVLYQRSFGTIPEMTLRRSETANRHRSLSVHASGCHAV